MPNLPLKRCSATCPQLVPLGSRCPTCTQAQRQVHRRFHVGGGFYGRRWAKAARRHLAAHPFCVDCLAKGEYTAATEVDHDVPHRGDRRLFWDDSNWRSRCTSHHSAKTAREVGYGGPR
jgi:5-methylcytosine-specific restriction protein A